MKQKSSLNKLQLIDEVISVNIMSKELMLELNINDNLIMYLSKGGEPNPDGTGGGSPSYFVSRRRLVINPVNIKICI